MSTFANRMKCVPSCLTKSTIALPMLPLSSCSMRDWQFLQTTLRQVCASIRILHVDMLICNVEGSGKLSMTNSSYFMCPGMLSHSCYVFVSQETLTWLNYKRAQLPFPSLVPASPIDAACLVEPYFCTAHAKIDMLNLTNFYNSLPILLT